MLAAVAPEEDLILNNGGTAARWQGQQWRVAWVPQRSWLYEGRLVAEPDLVHGGERLVSVEDVSAIRQRATPSAAPGGKVVFRPVNANEDEEKNLRASIEEAQKRRESRK